MTYNQEKMLARLQMSISRNTLTLCDEDVKKCIKILKLLRDASLKSSHKWYLENNAWKTIFAGSFLSKITE